MKKLSMKERKRKRQWGIILFDHAFLKNLVRLRSWIEISINIFKTTPYGSLRRCSWRKATEK